MNLFFFHAFLIAIDLIHLITPRKLTHVQRRDTCTKTVHLKAAVVKIDVLDKGLHWP